MEVHKDAKELNFETKIGNKEEEKEQRFHEQVRKQEDLEDSVLVLKPEQREAKRQKSKRDAEIDGLLDSFYASQGDP